MINKFRNSFAFTSSLIKQHVRFLNLHEFQSKDLMQKHGVTIQKFQMAKNLEDAKKISKEFKVDEYVIKAQILAGGRGKGTFSNGYKGGVRLTKNPDDVPSIVEKMLGHRLTTKQTPQDGVMVRQVMVAEALDIVKETYVAFLMDRDLGGAAIVASPDGGMDIEEVAATKPDSILTLPINGGTGLTESQASRVAEHLQFPRGSPQHHDAAQQLIRLYQMFTSLDCVQIEINPFGQAKDGRIVCFDAKLNFDDNAEFRQQSIFAEEDTSEMDVREVEASRERLNYIGMDGNIGCMVNGAGLAMATMDIIKLHGGSPANFLDVGGGVTQKQVENAFKLLTKDETVKCIFVNVFAGIINCETIAKGITNACKSVQLKVPLIVRLVGNNAEKAREIIDQSGLPIQTALELDEAAKKAVNSVASI